jgi:hypothetical protein
MSPQSTGASVQQLLPVLQSTLQSLPPQNRAAVASFWAQVRTSLVSLETEVAHLQEQLPLAHGLGSRPTTAASIQSLRVGIDRALEEQGLREPSVSETLERIYPLDPAWVHAILVAQRTNTNDRGCWLSNKTAAHENGYIKLNLRNTRVPGTNRLVGCQPFLHQLAVVSDGRGGSLLATSSGERQVSHLCNIGGCFNPQHLVIESAGLNARRRLCIGHYEVRCRCCNARYHPCVHGTEEWRLRCILPRRELEPGRYSQNGLHGPQALN